MAIVRRTLLGAVGVLLALLVWQVAASGASSGQKVFPTATEVAASAAASFVTVEFWATLAETAWLWLVGMICVIAVAIPVGVVMGTSRPIREWTASTVDFLRSIPHVALLPVALVILGSHQSMVTVMVVIGAVWPLLIQTIAGVASVDPVTTDSARTMRLGWRYRFFDVLVPGAMPYVATGLRLSASLTLIIVVVSGMLAGTPGLGLSIARAQEGFKPTELYVYVFVVGALGLLLNGLFALLEGRLLRWQNMGAR